MLRLFAKKEKKKKKTFITKGLIYPVNNKKRNRNLMTIMNTFSTNPE